MATHRFFVPHWRPSSLNSMIGRHWGVVAKLKRADRIMVGTYAKIRDVPRATRKRQVSLEIVLCGRQQETDPDALYKSLLDSLVHARLLVDDSPKYCSLGPVSFARGTKEEAGTTIVLEDLN